MSEQVLDQRKKLIREYKSTWCHCKRRKKARVTFCTHCYYGLPSRLRRGLYRTIGRGYEEAYDAAVSYLKTGD